MSIPGTPAQNGAHSRSNRFISARRCRSALERRSCPSNQASNQKRFLRYSSSDMRNMGTGMCSQPGKGNCAGSGARLAALSRIKPARPSKAKGSATPYHRRGLAPFTHSASIAGDPRCNRTLSIASSNCRLRLMFMSVPFQAGFPGGGMPPARKEPLPSLSPCRS